MVSAISGGFDASRMADMRQKLFERMDANGDGGIDLDEFKAGAPRGGQGEGPNPAEMFAKIDADGDGSISQDEHDSFLSGMMSSSTQAALLDAQERAAEMFAQFDANGDGGIDLDEFKAAAPKDRAADDAKASEMFAKIDANGDGVIDEAEHEAFLNEMGPPPPPPEGMTGQGEGEDEDEALASLFNTLDTNGDGMISAEELAAALASEKETNAAETQGSLLLEQIRSVIDGYRSGSRLGSLQSTVSSVTA